jgi:hypothetical protein
MLGIGRGIYLLGRTENAIKNSRQIFSFAAESDTGHLLVCYHTLFCIVPLHKQLHIYNSYDYDYDRCERLLTFVVDVTGLEKYQVLFCF